MYDYESNKAHMFTEDGQKMFLSIRDRTNRLIDVAGAVSMGMAISGETGISWHMIACVDRLVELGEIHEVEMTHPVRGQNRLFFKHR
tara:strand:+ start:53 stop:313 length:261 start_codon:yes stop_codon:yes gene_type:complete